MLNNKSITDARKVSSGKDGQLFVSNKYGTNIFLAEVDTFQVQVSISNSDWQPVGSLLKFAIPTACSITLALTETVIRDDVMLTELLDDLVKGYLPVYEFQGKLRRRDGQAERIVFRNCVPDGSIDIMNVSPGDFIKRAWSFRVNSMPETLENFVNIDSWTPIE